VTVTEGLRTLEPSRWTLSVELPALCVRGGPWEWDGGHVVGLQLVPVRLVVQESRLELNEDLQGVKKKVEEKVKNIFTENGSKLLKKVLL